MSGDQDGNETSAAESDDGGDEASLPTGVRWAVNLLLFSLSIVVALGAGEIVVRLVAPQQLIVIRPDIWQSVDSLGWRHTPDLDTEINTGERTVSFVTDREGFRVRPEGRVEATDSILLFGDSFMVALQVEYEQSLAGLMEDSLSGPDGQTVAVRNSGVGSWGPTQYLIFGRRRLADYRYGLCVVALFAGNDIVRERTEYVPMVERGGPPRFRIPLSLSPRAWIENVARPINDALESNSHLFVFLKNRLEPLRIRLGLSAAYIPQGILKARADGPEWAVTADVLADLADAADSANVPILFVLIPAEYQVDLELFASHAAAFGVDETSVDLDQPNERLRGEMEERGLHVIDALPAFRDAMRNDVVLYGSVDSHLSPAGHRALFDLLRDHMARRMLWSVPD